MAVFRANQPIEPKIVEIGKIYKGGKKKTVNRKGKEIQVYGDELEYYRFEPLERFKKVPSITGKFNSLYDELLARYEELDKPKQVHILFPYPNVMQVWRPSNQKWQMVGKESMCVRYCDGKICSIHLDEEGDSPYAPIPCSAKEGDKKCPKECKPTGQLRFTIPELRYPGEVVLTTHSIKDITTISGNLEAYKEYDLRDIPFVLVKTQQNCRHVTPEGKTFNPKKWFCHLEVEPEFGIKMVESRVEAIKGFATLSAKPQASDFVVPVTSIVPKVEVELKPKGVSSRQKMCDRITSLTDKLQSLRSTPVPLPKFEEMDDKELIAWGMDLRRNLEQALRQQIRILWVKHREQKVEIPEEELEIELETTGVDELDRVYRLAVSRLEVKDAAGTK